MSFCRLDDEENSQRRTYHEKRTLMFHMAGLFTIVTGEGRVRSLRGSLQTETIIDRSI